MLTEAFVNGSIGDVHTANDPLLESSFTSYRTLKCKNNGSFKIQVTR